MISAPPPVHPWPIGVGPRYQPTASNEQVSQARPFGRFRCASGRAFDVHVELFAKRRVMILPAGVGVAKSGCHYPLSTATPTGVVAVRRAGSWTLGDLFAVWGRTLTGSRLLSFRGDVAAYVGGQRVGGDPRRIRLTPHAQIVIEVGGYIAPHATYLFPKGHR
jgi:hypothetical protein